MKRYFFLSFFLCISSFASIFAIVDAPVAFVLELNHDAFIYSKNIDTPMYPASLTKLATGLYAVESTPDHYSPIVPITPSAIGSISTSRKKKSNYTLPSWWIEVASSHVGLKRKEEFQFNDLLESMMIASANDSSNVIAEHLGAGSISQFLQQMNIYLSSIGCTQTHFTNPHGLHHPNHKTCGRDLSIIGRKILEYPKLLDIMGKNCWIRPKTNLQKSAPYHNTHPLIRKGKYHDERCYAGKVGRTNDSGYHLISYVKTDNLNLLILVAGTQRRSHAVKQTKQLIDYAIENGPQEVTLLDKGHLTLKKQIPNSLKLLSLEIKEPLIATQFPDHLKLDYSLAIEWSVSPHIQVGQQAAIIKAIDREGKLLAQQDIFVSNIEKPSLIEILKLYLTPKLLAVCAIVLLFIFLFFRR